MSKYEIIKERYIKGYVTDEQLEKYWQLGVLTEEQYWEIYYTKHERPEEVLEEQDPENIIVEDQEEANENL